MNSNSSNMTYDYVPCGFSKFPDGSKFKYGDDGEICLATDCSTWAKQLLNNLSLPEYLYSEALVPPERMLFPEFGTLERKKRKKESVGKYIEDCEFCGEYMEKTFRVSFEDDYKLVCEDCNKFFQKEKCLLCKQRQNRYFEKIITNSEDLDGEDYCSTCWGNLTQLATSYFQAREGYGYDEDDRDLDACPGCGIDNGGSLCYWCRHDDGGR
jgi:hypothetical protein